MSAATSVRLRPATPADLEAIGDLLKRNQLPGSDLRESRPEFIVACEAQRILGTGALQPFGHTALLRSLAVDTTSRGAGLGRLIVAELERRARAAGIGELVLLTLTARGFFEHLGYGVKDRAEVPAVLLDSAEFRSLCPASAICMTKSLYK